MRLTLRTLLAYLDDTLQANEIKEIGEKVAESDAARELVARIKQVTRRRRLTVPPATGPDGFDPNDVAEYLDNELDSDKVAELEKQCLDSDVHLAEIAACHQILTLVLGEPALVPPKAKERMYGLVRGREAIPYRKAGKPQKAKGDALDEDEIAISGNWMPWALPVAGLLLIVALGAAVYQVLPERKADRRQAAAGTGGSEKGTEQQARPGGETEKKAEPKRTELAKNTTDRTKTDEGGGEGKGKGEVKKGPVDGKEKKGKGAETKGGGGDGGGGADLERIAPPSKDREEAGRYVGAEGEMPTSLLVRAADGKAYESVARDRTVYTSDTLLALPGMAAQVSTKGVSLLLRGSTRELALVAPMLNLKESVVVLHYNNQFDMDLTVLRGRVFLRNNKGDGACKVRLRFDEEVWDIRLPEPGDEVGFDLTRSYTPLLDPRKGDAPEAEAYLAVFKGDVGVMVNGTVPYTVRVEPPRFGLMRFTSSTRVSAPEVSDSVPLAWGKGFPTEDKIPEERRAEFRPFFNKVKELQGALANLQALLRPRKSPAIALEETRRGTGGPTSRVLAIYGLGAIDDLDKVLEALNDGDRNHREDREAAFFTLRAWANRVAGQDERLYDPKTDSGLLRDLKFKSGDARAVRALLYPLRASDMRKVETFEYLANRLTARPAVAEMAYWHLVWLSPRNEKGQSVVPANFNAADAYDDRKAYADQIQKLITDRVLPPGAAAEAAVGGGKDKDKGEAKPGE